MKNKATRQEPVLHKSVRMGSLVKFHGLSEVMDGKTGEVIGVASFGIIHNYIVFLDEPYYDEGQNETWEAIVVPGPLLQVLV